MEKHYKSKKDFDNDPMFRDEKKKKVAKKMRKSRAGVPEDWGKTKPYWSLKTGRGYDEPYHVRSYK